METRILIAKGLQVIVIDDEKVKLEKRKHLHKSIAIEDEIEEKPSSSSGHGETGSEPSQIKEYKSSSSSSSSSSNSDTSSSSSPTDTEVESEVSLSRNSPRSENLIGSSETVSTRKRRKKSNRNNFKQKSKSFGEEMKLKKGQSIVKICATRPIEKGTVFTPNDGDVQVVHLKGIPSIPRDDVRFVFGCFETLAPSTPLTPTSPPPVAASTATTTSPETTDDSLIRLCNWIRFLPSAKASGRRTSSSGTLSTDSSDSELENNNRSDDDQDQDSYTSSDNNESWKRGNARKSFDPVYNLRNANDLTNAPVKEGTGTKRQRHRRDQRYSDNLRESLKANNIIARFVDGRPLFEATTRLVPGTELVAHFDMDSFTKRASQTATSTFNAMMGSTPAQTSGKLSTHQSNPISSSSPPPAPSSSTSTSISSSSSSSLVGVGRGCKNGKESDRDERGQPIQHSLFHCYPSYALHHHHYYHQQQPLFPNGSLFNDHNMKYFLNRVAGNVGDGKDEIDHSKSGTGGVKIKVEVDALMGSEGDEGRKQSNEMSTDGPLDLTKLSNDPTPGIKMTDSETSHIRRPEPLKIGTPFDSPDSNDDDKSLVGQGRDCFGKELRSTSRAIHGKNTSSNMFSIRNVLKRKSSPSPPAPSSAKLFQPYCFDDSEKGKEMSWKRGSPLQQGIVPHNANLFRSAPLATPPYNRSSVSPGGIQTSAAAVPVLRPILRTRGRERSLLPCEVCGKAFDRPSLLKRHLRTHTGEKPHVCDVCSKGFSTSSSLNTHRRIHSGEKPHQCPICGKRFTASSNLYYHRMTHNKEKPHKCMLCGKSFPTPGDLKSHQYVHSGSWPYTCPVCHRGFSKQTNLRNHLLLHSGMGSNSISNKPGEKQHSCHICEKKFALPSNLRAHIKTHEESDPASSTCVMCKRSFLPSLNMLVNGRCRTCIYNAASTNSDGRMTIDSQRSSDTTSPQSVHLSQMEKVKSNFPSLSMESALQRKLLSPNPIHGLGQLPPQQNPLSQFALPQIPTFPMSGLPNALSLSSTALAAPGFHFPPTSSINPTATPNSVTAATAALFRNAGGGSPATNPFIEHLLELNYRYAKETAGSLSLSIIQQKLLESQMFAAQLMSSQGFGMNSASTTVLQDMLKFRAAAAGAEGFRQLDSVGTENKFMQR